MQLHEDGDEDADAANCGRMMIVMLMMLMLIATMESVKTESYKECSV